MCDEFIQYKIKYLYNVKSFFILQNYHRNIDHNIWIKSSFIFILSTAIIDMER